MIKVLIFGANGMLGHKLIQQLEPQFDVYGTIRGTFDTVEKYGIFDKAKTIENVSATDISSIEAAVRTPQPDVVINAVGIIKQVPSEKDVITAVGIAEQIEIMAAAIIIAVFVMMVAINPIAAFIDTHKEIKIVALSFLLLVGFILVAEAMGTPIPKGYLYFALGFAGLVQGLILWAQSSEKQLELLAKNEETKDVL